MKLTIKQVSSLEKIRSTEDIPNRSLFKKCLLGGESFSYQIVLSSDEATDITFDISSPLKDFISLYSVDEVIMDYPGMPAENDDDYITNTPGTMPDLLTPLENTNGHIRMRNNVNSVWVKVDIPKDFTPGTYPIEITANGSCIFRDNEDFVLNQVLTIEVLGINIPDQKTIFTQWFHTDCIASAHNVEIYSEAHWDLIDKYMKMASEIGINMILTPVITPPLDTGIGKMRPCTQLVKIQKSENTYSFDFTLLTRWINLCKKNGIKYYEISHLFSQWGLAYAPNIMVTENGEEKHMFGWHVAAQSAEYREFLKQFVPALMKHLESEGITKNCYFHLSDEPHLDHVENYRYARDLVKPMIGDCQIMDAISNIEFYDTGLLPVPVTATDVIEPFLEKKIDNQWVYYCCVQTTKVGNRFLSMPSYRNRILGLQLYKYDIKGFLQWGYNFYYSSLSVFKVNPYVTTSAGQAFLSGDSFSVYPGNNEVLPSLRAIIFKEALQEIELCRLLESFIGKEKVIELIEQEAGMEITFKDYPRNADFLPNLNNKIKETIKKYL